MADDVRGLLARGARVDAELDAEAVLRRAHRLSWRERLIGLAVVVLLVPVAVLAAVGGDDGRIDFADDPPTEGADPSTEDADPGGLQVPPPGEAVAAVLDDGVPVWVVQGRDGEVAVVDARSSGTDWGLGALVQWCPSSQGFEDPFGSAFDAAGRYRWGPAPAGLDTFSVSTRAGGRIALGPRQEAPGRDDPDAAPEAPAGPSCLEGQPGRGTVGTTSVASGAVSSVAHALPGVPKVDVLPEVAEGPVLLSGALVVTADGAVLCWGEGIEQSEPPGCRPAVPVPDVEGFGFVRGRPWAVVEGTMLVRFDRSGLGRVVTSLQLVVRADEDRPQRPGVPVDGPLVLGALLPLTGDLVDLGPPLTAAAELAVADVNAAGGVLGADVRVELRDTGDGFDEPEGAGAFAQELVDAGVDAVVGPVSSRAAYGLVPLLAGRSGVLVVSPTATRGLGRAEHGGLYQRTAPPDVLQGVALADAIRADGGERVGILARSDEYGQGIAQALRRALLGTGTRVVAEAAYDQTAMRSTYEVDQLAAAAPDTVVVAGFDESASFLQMMVEAGIGPRDLAVWGVDGNASDELAVAVDPTDPGVLAGMRGVRPGTASIEGFTARLRASRPDLPAPLTIDAAVVEALAARAYDATVLVALAAARAGSSDPTQVRDAMVELSRPGATACAEAAACLTLLAAGEAVTYSGVLGPADIGEDGEPRSAVFEAWEIDAAGRIRTTGTLDVTD